MKTDVERPDTMAFINEALRNVNVVLCADDILDIANALENHTRKVVLAPTPSAGYVERPDYEKIVSRVVDAIGALNVGSSLEDQARAAIAAIPSADGLREALREARRLCDQVPVDLASAHAEICNLQGIDPETHTWPEWTPQANTLRWLDRLKPQIDAALASKGGE